MGYEPTNWKTGDVITAEKLNKLEDGVASGGGGSDAYDFVIDMKLDDKTGNVTISANVTVEDALTIVKNCYGNKKAPNVLFVAVSNVEGEVGMIERVSAFQFSMPHSSISFQTVRGVVYGNAENNTWTIQDQEGARS